MNRPGKEPKEKWKVGKIIGWFLASVVAFGACAATLEGDKKSDEEYVEEYDIETDGGYIEEYDVETDGGYVEEYDDGDDRVLVEVDDEYEDLESGKKMIPPSSKDNSSYGG
jgi:hypothetical protein